MTFFLVSWIAHCADGKRAQFLGMGLTVGVAVVCGFEVEIKLHRLNTTSVDSKVSASVNEVAAPASQTTTVYP